MPICSRKWISAFPLPKEFACYFEFANATTWRFVTLNCESEEIWLVFDPTHWQVETPFVLPAAVWASRGAPWVNFRHMAWQDTWNKTQDIPLFSLWNIGSLIEMDGLVGFIRVNVGYSFQTNWKQWNNPTVYSRHYPTKISPTGLALLGKISAMITLSPGDVPCYMLLEQVQASGLSQLRGVIVGKLMGWNLSPTSLKKQTESGKGELTFKINIFWMELVESDFDFVNTVDGSELPNNHLGCIKPL